MKNVLFGVGALVALVVPVGCGVEGEVPGGGPDDVGVETVRIDGTDLASLAEGENLVLEGAPMRQFRIDFRDGLDFSRIVLADDRQEIELGEWLGVLAHGLDLPRWTFDGDVFAVTNDPDAFGLTGTRLAQLLDSGVVAIEPKSLNPCPEYYVLESGWYFHSIICEGVDFGSCGAPAETTTCDVDLGDGTVSCDNGAPMALVDTSTVPEPEGNGSLGLVYDLDMSQWSSVVAVAHVCIPTDWAITLGNSPTNSGYAGDDGTTSNDSAMQLKQKKLSVYYSDRGGSGTALEVPQSVATIDHIAMVVCDGQFSFQSSRTAEWLASDYLYQIDGDEPDAEAGSNDQNLWLGIRRTVGDGSRDGDGVESMQLIFGR